CYRKYCNVKIYFIDMAGETIKFITEVEQDVETYDRELLWNSSMLVYTTYNHAMHNEFCMGYTRGAIKKLFEGDRPEFSPDGKKLAFYSYNNGSNIGIYNFSTGKTTHIADNPEIIFFSGSKQPGGINICPDLAPFSGFNWASDSKRISFCDWWGVAPARHTTAKNAGRPRAAGVYTCKIDGSDFHKIPLGCEVTSYDLAW
ncbi:MAG: hypothetical protein ABRQ37_25570, partial [Candidatus Eremiobacterota bacterium]